MQDSYSEKHKQVWNPRKVLPPNYITKLFGESTWEDGPKKTSITNNYYYTEITVWQAQGFLHDWSTYKTNKLR